MPGSALLSPAVPEGHSQAPPQHSTTDRAQDRQQSTGEKIAHSERKRMRGQRENVVLFVQFYIILSG